MARKKKARSVEELLKRFGEALYNSGSADEDGVQEAVGVLRKELEADFDPAGVLRFTLEHPLLWWWRAKVVGVTDGDTMDVFLDRGFRDTHTERIRLHRINAWETRGRKAKTEGERGRKATRWVKKILKVNREILVHTTGPDDRGSFGRWLAQLWVPMSEEEVADLAKLSKKKHGLEDGYWPEESADRLFGKVLTMPLSESKEQQFVNLGEWMLELGHARPYKRG